MEGCKGVKTEHRFPYVENEQPDEGIKKLAAAIISSAFNDLVDPLWIKSSERKDLVKLRERLAMNAIKWLDSEEHYVCSYLWCCDILKVNPKKIRDQILLRRKNNIKRETRLRLRFSTIR